MKKNTIVKKYEMWDGNLWAVELEIGEYHLVVNFDHEPTEAEIAAAYAGADAGIRAREDFERSIPRFEGFTSILPANPEFHATLTDCDGEVVDEYKADGKWFYAIGDEWGPIVGVTWERLNVKQMRVAKAILLRKRV